MQYHLKGRLEAAICDDCLLPLAGATVRLYGTQNPEASGMAVLDAKAIAAKEDRLLTDEPILAEPIRADDDGVFETPVPDPKRLHEAEYEGIEVDAVLTALPSDDPEDSVGLGRDAVQVTLGSLSLAELANLTDKDGRPPLMRIPKTFSRIPKRVFCKLLEYLGRWVICGHVRDASGQGFPQATVQAFDADWIQDDAVGSATTDGDGRFLIYYTEDDFDDTPIMGFETELVGGPDLYFKVDRDGQRYIDEVQSDGRTPARENRGHCFCVTLTVDFEQQTPPMWTTVHERFDIRSDFDAEGYIHDGRLVLRDHVPAEGHIPLMRNGGPLKYRFLFGAWTPSGPPADADLTPVTNIERTKIGDAYLAGYQPEPVYIANLDGDGWVEWPEPEVTLEPAPGSSSSALTIKLADLVSRPRGGFEFGGTLMKIDTVDALAPPPTGVPSPVAGNPLPTGDQVEVQRYRLRFQVEDPNGVQDVGTLDAIIDNSLPVAALAVQELAADLCAEISSKVNIEYTVDHPHLRNFSITIRNNNGVVHDGGNSGLPDETYDAQSTPTSFRGGNGTEEVDVSNDPTCAYEVTLSYGTRHYPGRAWSPKTKLYCTRDAPNSDAPNS